MAKSSTRELHALRNLIAEADLILSTTELPQGRSKRARELLSSAISLTEDFINQVSSAAYLSAKVPAKPAAVLGQKGGATTAKRGSEYFRQLAARRKTQAGGRPRKAD